MYNLSASGLTRVTAAALPFQYFDHIVTEDEVQFPVKRHRYGHICKKISQTGHFPDSSTGFSPLYIVYFKNRCRSIQVNIYRMAVLYTYGEIALENY